tara:strand:- start:596 stop:1456 length:861 start_codon:yes stop_codon:yes gene_type:complete
MRRTIRDAIVGLSILGGIVIFAGTTLWLRGVQIGSKKWSVQANFSDATGLAERSPVTFRGILIGSVSKINVRPENVQAIIDINDSKLRLPKPIIAKVITSSLLGADAQIALVSLKRILPPNSPLPKSKECSKSKILCEGDLIEGKALTSISTMTSELQKLIKQADKENIVSNLVESTRQFDLTQKNLDDLIMQVKDEISRVEPILENLTEASSHVNNILASIDNPETLDDIKKTASSTRSLAGKIDNLGTDFSKIMDDKELMSAIRSLTIGLGELFNELYPETNKN